MHKRIRRGQFSVTITNGTCETIETYELTAPDSLILVATQQWPTCHDASDGKLQVQAFGGTSPYTYSWDNGLQIQQRDGLTSGVYSISVEDAAQCLLVQSITLGAPAPLQITWEETQMAACYGGNEGSILATGTGGTLPYSYSWDNETVTPSLSNLQAGDYSLTLTDRNDCSVSDTFTVTQPDSLIVSWVVIQQPDCVGDTNGAIELQATGGTGSYTFLWQDGVQQSSPLRTGLQAGNYAITVTDSNDCTAIISELLLQPISTLSITTQITPPACVGKTGSVQVTAGGVAPFDFQWSNGDGDALLNDVPVGIYQLTLTDSRGCILDTNVVIAAPQVFLFNHAVVQPSCFGVNDGIIDQTILQGGTPPYQFFWNNNTQHVDQMFLAPGDYQFTVTDFTGCQFISDTFTMQYPPLLDVAIVDMGGIACAGDTTGYIETLATGGTPPYSYSWIGTGIQTHGIYDLPAGNYQLVVSDNRNCIQDVTVALLRPSHAKYSG
ncbi:MAG: SprB repeat-containing protein [Saprospiraceae bacterium]